MPLGRFKKQIVKIVISRISPELEWKLRKKKMSHQTGIKGDSANLLHLYDSFLIGSFHSLKIFKWPQKREDEKKN